MTLLRDCPEHREALVEFEGKLVCPYPGFTLRGMPMCDYAEPLPPDVALRAAGPESFEGMEAEG